jgi:hypothetical protein
MAIPNKAVGYGNNSTARNVFAVNFSQSLSSAVKYEMYDGASFPAVGSAVTVANTCFAGTAGNSNKSMWCLVDTTNAAPSSNWKPASATGGTANPNRMKGTTSFVTQAGSNRVGAAAPGDANSRITFNMVLEIPSDATTSSTMAADLLVRYTYTGSAPTLAWLFNDAVSGTEGTPTWTTLTPGTHGVRHTRSGTSGGGPYVANIPASSTEDTAEAWVTT